MATIIFIIASRHYITEILLKMPLNTITLSDPNPLQKVYIRVYQFKRYPWQWTRSPPPFLFHCETKWIIIKKKQYASRFQDFNASINKQIGSTHSIYGKNIRKQLQLFAYSVNIFNNFVSLSIGTVPVLFKRQELEYSFIL